MNKSYKSLEMINTCKSLDFNISILEVDKSLILFIATNTKGEIIGKCTLKYREENIIRFQDTFVDEKYRGLGVYRLLFKKRDEYVKNLKNKYVVESYCRKSTVKTFLKNGYEISHTIYLVKKSNK